MLVSFADPYYKGMSAIYHTEGDTSSFWNGPLIAACF